MGDVVTIDGSITLGPPGVSSDGSFPISAVDIPLVLLPSEKPATANSSKVTRSLTGGSYVTLRGVGDAVTKATFLYFRTTGAGKLRLTTDDGNGGDVVAVLPVKGLLVVEFDPIKFLKLLEGDFSGTVEYAVSGDL